MARQAKADKPVDAKASKSVDKTSSTIHSLFIIAYFYIFLKKNRAKKKNF